MNQFANPNAYADLMNSLGIQIMVLDADFRIEFVCDRIAQEDGRGRKGFVGELIWDYWPMLRTSPVGTLCREVMASRMAAGIIGNYPLDDGMPRWLKIDVRPWGDGIVCTASEVTDQKRVEAELQAGENRFELVAAASQDILYDWDIAGGNVIWGAKAREFFGPPEDPTPGFIETPLSSWTGIIHRSDYPRIWKSLERALDSVAPSWSGEYRMLQTDGVWATILDRGMIIRDSAGKATHLIGAMIDLTDARRSERELQRLCAQIGAIQRDSAMGTMGATMAHELAEPLTAIESYLGAAELVAATDHLDADKLRQCLAGARSGADRTQQIIKRLKALITRGEAQRAPIPLFEALESIIDEILAPYESDNIEVRLDIDPDLKFVGDPVQLLHVLSNLVRNSADAMKESAERRILIAAKRNAELQQFECRIEDTGPGVPSEIQHLIFSPFFGTKAAGSGIGLSVCRTIVEAHLGRIWYEANPAGGSIFHIVLPATDTAPVVALQ